MRENLLKIRGICEKQQMSYHSSLYFLEEYNIVTTKLQHFFVHIDNFKETKKSPPYINIGKDF